MRAQADVRLAAMRNQRPADRRFATVPLAFSLSRITDDYAVQPVRLYLW